MTRSIRTILFPLLSLFFIGAIAFLSLDSFRKYQAEVSIIVLPKGNVLSADQVVKNIAFLPKTIDFFDALLASDARLAEFSTLDEGPVSVRKEIWNKMLRVKHEEGSGIITYTMNADTQEEATILSRQMIRTLFEKIGVYYDIRSEISIRLVEGPLVRTTIASPFWWVSTSLVAGMLLALIASALILKIESILSSSHRMAGASGKIPAKTDESHLPSIHPATFVPKKPFVLFSESGEAKAKEEKWDQVLAEQERAESTAETPALVYPKPAMRTVENTGAAPANLPVMDETEFLAQFSGNNSSDKESSAERQIQDTAVMEEPVSSEESPLPHEPTVEDYRRRLNELLRMGK